MFKKQLPFIAIINFGLFLLFFTLSGNENIQKISFLPVIFLDLGYLLGTIELLIVGYLINTYIKKNKYLNLINVSFICIFLLIIGSILYFVYQGNNLLLSNLFCDLIYLAIYIETLCFISLCINWLNKKEYKKIIRFIIEILLVFVILLVTNILCNKGIINNDLFHKIIIMLYFNCIVSFITIISTSVLYKTIKVD